MFFCRYKITKNPAWSVWRFSDRIQAVNFANAPMSQILTVTFPLCAHVALYILALNHVRYDL